MGKLIYTTAIVIIPTENVWPAIQAIRTKHDAKIADTNLSAVLLVGILNYAGCGDQPDGWLPPFASMTCSASFRRRSLSCSRRAWMILLRSPRESGRATSSPSTPSGTSSVFQSSPRRPSCNAWLEATGHPVRDPACPRRYLIGPGPRRCVRILRGPFHSEAR